MAAFYDYFNEQKYADAVKNVSGFSSVTLFKSDSLYIIKVM